MESGWLGVRISDNMGDRVVVHHTRCAQPLEVLFILLISNKKNAPGTVSHYNL